MPTRAIVSLWRSWKSTTDDPGIGDYWAAHPDHWLWSLMLQVSTTTLSWKDYQRHWCYTTTVVWNVVSHVSMPTNQHPNTAPNKHNQHMTACNYLGFAATYYLECACWIQRILTICFTRLMLPRDQSIDNDGALAVISEVPRREGTNKIYITT